MKKYRERDNSEYRWRGFQGNMDVSGSGSARFYATVQNTGSVVKLNIDAAIPIELILTNTRFDQPDTASASGEPARLVVTYGGRIGREFPLIQEDSRIGRKDKSEGIYPDIDLAEDDPGHYISRRHAHILKRNGRYFLEDLKSTNHTLLNKVVLNPYCQQELRDGDSIILGKTFMIFSMKKLT